MCAAYAASDGQLVEFNNGFGTILSLCGSSGVDEITDTPWSGAIDGYFSMGRRFAIDIRHELIDNLELSGETSDIRILLNYRWVVALGPSGSPTQADLVAALGETDDPAGWRPLLNAGCFYATLAGPVTGSYTEENSDSPDTSIEINGYESELPSGTTIQVLLEPPSFFVLPQPNVNQSLMPIPQDGLAWAPYHPYTGGGLYTSLLPLIEDDPRSDLGLGFAEFSTPRAANPNQSDTLDTCEHLKNFALFVKRGGSVSTSDEQGSSNGARSLSFVVDHNQDSRRIVDYTYNIGGSANPDQTRLIRDDMSANLVVLEQCPPESSIYTLPPITCGPGGGPNRVAVSCVGEIPAIVYEPSTRPTDASGDGIVYQSNRYIPLSQTSADSPVVVQWQDHRCDLVRLGPRCDGNGPPHPYRVADVPPGSGAFRVGADIYRTVGGAFSSRAPLPVDEWLDQCPQDEFFLATKCRPGSRGPETTRYRRVDGLTPGQGRITRLTPTETDGCFQLVQYRPTATPTTDTSLIEVFVQSGTPCVGPDPIRCVGDNNTGTPIDLGVICFLCEQNQNPTPNEARLCAELCDRRSTAGRTSRIAEASAPMSPAMRAAIEAQRRASGCRSCGDPGGSELM